MNIILHPFFDCVRRRRQAATGAALGLALLLAACGRNTTKAIQLEAQADQAIAAGNLPTAVFLLDRANEYDSNDAGRWVKLGRAFQALKSPVPAVHAFEQARDLDPANIEALQNLAVLYIAGRRFDQAQDIVDPLLSLSPNDIAGTFAGGAIAYYQERYAEALKTADQLIQLAPDSKEGYVLKAHVLEKIDRSAEGAVILEKRMALTPDDSDLALQLLELYQSYGNVAGVRSISVRLAKLLPDDPRYQLESLRAFQADGNTAERERVTAYLLDRYKNNPSILGAVADFWMGALPHDETVRRTADLAARSQPRVRAALALRLVVLGAYDAATPLLAPVAATNVTTDNVDLHAALAALLVAEGKAQAALKEAQRVVGFDGTNPTGLLARAGAYLLEKAYDKARVDAQVVISNDPDNVNALLLIARTYAAQNSDALTVAAYSDAQAAAPKSTIVLRARTDWLIAHDRAAEAAQIASLFTQTHPSIGDGWTIYEDTCRAAHDQICLLQARLRGKG